MSKFTEYIYCSILVVMLGYSVQDDYKEKISSPLSLQSSNDSSMSMIYHVTLKLRSRQYETE